MPTKRQRAPAMNVELRRAAIVAYTLPLLVEHGPNVTTSQIAAAAGIAEGTVFRAFRDKHELLTECMRTALESDTEARLIESIDRTLPLAERLAKAVGWATDYQNRLWAVGQAARTAGTEFRREDFDRDEHHHMPQGMVRVHGALAGLFLPDAESLRVAPEVAAQMLLALVFASRLQATGLGTRMVDVPDLVDLFLHGILLPAKEKHD